MKVRDIPLDVIKINRHTKGCYLNDELCWKLKHEGKEFIRRFTWFYLFYNNHNTNFNRFIKCPWCIEELKGWDNNDKLKHIEDEHYKNSWDYFEFRNQRQIYLKFHHLTRKHGDYINNIYVTYSGCQICEIPYGYIKEKCKRSCKQNTVKSRFRSFESIGIDLNNLFNDEDRKKYLYDENQCRRFGGLLVKTFEKLEDDVHEFGR